MLLRSQLCQVSSGLHTNGSSTQQLLCTPTGRTTSSRAAAPYAGKAINIQLRRCTSGVSGSTNSNSGLARSAGVICRDAPRPMWAARAPNDDELKAAGDAVARMITRELGNCDSLVALSDVHNEWGGSFNYIHAAAAITKYAKTRRDRSTDIQLLPKLLRCWLQQLPFAEERQCTNVLWALSKLGTGLDEVWEPTMEAFLRLLQQDAQLRSVSPQNLSNTLWACAKSRKQPAPGQLAVLMRAILQPDMLAGAKAQELANMVWALGKLCQLEGWQGAVAEDEVQQLLGPQQLQLLSENGTAQAISNVLLGLTYMSTAAAPVVSKACAQQCSRQLLASNAQRLITSDPQHVGNAMWACGQLGMTETSFLEEAAVSAARWVPGSQSPALVQAATACAKLQFRHEGLITALLQRGQQLQQQLQATNRIGRQQQAMHPERQNDHMLGSLCSAVAHLDMQQLAPQALQLVATNNFGRRTTTHKATLHHLWLFHSWLLQHQLLDGQGLTGLLTQQQLQRGQNEAAQYPDYI